MTLSFSEKLRKISADKKSFVCVGLDPAVESMPEGISKDPQGIYEFCKAIVESTAPYAAAYKPNLAFFEAYGSEGIIALEKLMKVFPKDTIVIGDAKRSDIGNTAKRYAHALFKTWGFDAMTVNPYLGKDTLEPFIEDPEKGVFILCLTSNKGASDFQMPEKLYVKVAKSVLEINTRGNCGLVTGATHPTYLKEIRESAGDMPFLIPGIGAQGGDLQGTIENARDSKGGGFVINASRSIIYASKGKDFAERAAEEAKILRDQINALLK